MATYISVGLSMRPEAYGHKGKIFDVSLVAEMFRRIPAHVYITNSISEPIFVEKIGDDDYTIPIIRDEFFTTDEEHAKLEEWIMLLKQDFEINVEKVPRNILDIVGSKYIAGLIGRNVYFTADEVLTIANNRERAQYLFNMLKGSDCYVDPLGRYHVLDYSNDHTMLIYGGYLTRVKDPIYIVPKLLRTGARIYTDPYDEKMYRYIKYYRDGWLSEMFKNIALWDDRRMMYWNGISLKIVSFNDAVLSFFEKPKPATGEETGINDVPIRFIENYIYPDEIIKHLGAKPIEDTVEVMPNLVIYYTDSYDQKIYAICPRKGALF